jgi:hypothetical protein
MRDRRSGVLHAISFLRLALNQATMRISLLFLIGSVLTAGGCVSMTIEVERDATVFVPEHAGWAWRPRPWAPLGESELHPRVDNPRARERVEGAIDAVLRDKGFPRVEPDVADVLVDYRMGVWEEQARIEPAPAVAPSPRSAEIPPGEALTRSGTRVRYQEGALLINVTERTTDRLAFRVAGKRVLGRPMSDEALRQAIAELFARFP